MSNKTGRPKAEIDWAVVDNYLKAQCDGTEIAEFFGIAPITLYRACEREYNVTFDVYKQQKTPGFLNLRKIMENDRMRYTDFYKNLCITKERIWNQ